MEENIEKQDQEVQGESTVHKELEQTKQLLDEVNDKYVRLYAEYDNFRKRSSKEKSDIIKFAGEDVIKSLLPVLDNFERALTTNQDEGVALIYNSLLKTLESKGLKEMDVLGQDFDPDLHEAISQIQNSEMSSKVIDVLEKGYYLNDKVIRFAKVVVGI